MVSKISPCSSRLLPTCRMLSLMICDFISVLYRFFAVDCSCSELWKTTLAGVRGGAESHVDRRLVGVEHKSYRG